MNTKLIVSGCLGRMGKMISRLVLLDSELELIVGVEQSAFPGLKDDLGSTILGEKRGILIVEDIREHIKNADLVIEFSTPDATLRHLRVVSEFGKGMVIGTTGFNAEQLKELENLSERAAVLISPNMSIGINVLFKIIPQLTELLGEDYDIEVVEAHHNKKKDAPSGTAKRIAELIKSVRRDLVLTYGREGSSAQRKKNDLTMHALRLGEIVGEHKIIFAGNNEVIELSHSAISRDIFARGAILGVKYIKDKKAGLYTMQDVLSAKLGG
ncbi:MAG: 4-hydroxy-tetrahydrodipicolinate reductase [Candidatus Kaelpia aquatica]|nr:4-hydroxy-tetrahydrodipicolinate reductase [Candidatus Kaelpia aquatica]